MTMMIDDVSLLPPTVQNYAKISWIWMLPLLWWYTVIWSLWSSDCGLKKRYLGCGDTPAWTSLKAKLIRTINTFIVVNDPSSNMDIWPMLQSATRGCFVVVKLYLVTGSNQVIVMNKLSVVMENVQEVTYLSHVRVTISLSCNWALTIWSCLGIMISIFNVIDNEYNGTRAALWIGGEPHFSHAYHGCKLSHGDNLQKQV